MHWAGNLPQLACALFVCVQQSKSAQRHQIVRSSLPCIAMLTLERICFASMLSASWEGWYAGSNQDTKLSSSLILSTKQPAASVLRCQSH